MKFNKVNVNPKGKRADDCVVRAIALATGQSWYEVYEDLCKLGAKKCLMPNDRKLFPKYLESLGWVKMKQPRKYDNTKYTVQEFADKLLTTNDMTIVSVAHHLTVVSEGNLYDTWNCSYKTVGNYWIKEGQNEKIRS